MSDKEQLRLGERLRNAREYLRLSQEEVANYLKIPRSAISLIESGQRKVDVLELKALAKLYQIPLSKLTGEKPETAESQDLELLKRAASDLTKKDREEVIRFAQYLRSRSQKGSKDDAT